MDGGRLQGVVSKDRDRAGTFELMRVQAGVEGFPTCRKPTRMKILWK